MFHRIVGALLVIGGLVIGAIGFNGWVDTESMAKTYSIIFANGAHNFHGGEFQAEQWTSHWRLMMLVLSGIGCLTVVAGVAVIAKKLWGYLVLSAAAVFAGTFPLINTMSGYARYSWEAGSIRSALPYILAALLAILVYMKGARKRPG